MVTIKNVNNGYVIETDIATYVYSTIKEVFVFLSYYYNIKETVQTDKLVGWEGCAVDKKGQVMDETVIMGKT